MVGQVRITSNTEHIYMQFCESLYTLYPVLAIYDTRHKDLKPLIVT
jgi:hypothetical protein